MEDEAARPTSDQTGQAFSETRGDRAAVLAHAWRATRMGARRSLRALVLRPGALALLVLVSATALATTLATSAAT
ncbi:hypothetical protein SAMN05414137_109263 [Streptacidiphilus jiangxiensis]|uniref:Uncharacterized protein n=1 Tax=Streptacidiphilus jiangxiensis TaxID=235985 RepID=A0A1H7QWX0_STRJI|nr:hypothetical protein SAMN05414137_109263 [Streptacidiphilus jiangxiensis]